MWMHTDTSVNTVVAMSKIHRFPRALFVRSYADHPRNSRRMRALNHLALVKRVGRFVNMTVRIDKHRLLFVAMQQTNPDMAGKRGRHYYFCSLGFGV